MVAEQWGAGYPVAGALAVLAPCDGSVSPAIARLRRAVLAPSRLVAKSLIGGRAFLNRCQPLARPKVAISADSLGVSCVMRPGSVLCLPCPRTRTQAR